MVNKKCGTDPEKPPTTLFCKIQKTNCLYPYDTSADCIKKKKSVNIHTTLQKSVLIKKTNVNIHTTLQQIVLRKKTNVNIHTTLQQIVLRKKKSVNIHTTLQQIVLRKKTNVNILLKLVINNLPIVKLNKKTAKNPTIPTKSVWKLQKIAEANTRKRKSVKLIKKIARVHMKVEMNVVL